MKALFVKLFQPFLATFVASLHALNSVFALFEILFTHAGPTPWTHIVFIIVLLASYLGVAYITRATQGFYSEFLDRLTVLISKLLPFFCYNFHFRLRC